MKYWVSGSSKETGARMGVEVEADSKAVAERDAGAMGMNVHRAVEMGSGLAPAPTPTLRSRRDRRASTLRVAFLVLLFVLAWYYVVPRIRHLLGH